MKLPFGLRDAGGFAVIDWGMCGGQWCRPATVVEVELFERIAALEALLCEVDGKLTLWSPALDCTPHDLQERIKAALGIGSSQERGP